MLSGDIGELLISFNIDLGAEATRDLQNTADAGNRGRGTRTPPPRPPSPLPLLPVSSVGFCEDSFFEVCMSLEYGSSEDLLCERSLLLEP